MENQFGFEKYRFEDLVVWQIGMQIIRETYRLVKKFPRDELFALTDQIKRAATSIVLNIAEGSGQPTKKGFCLYLERSKSSVLEVVSCLRIAMQENFIRSTDIETFENLLQELYFKLIALKKSMGSSH